MNARGQAALLHFLESDRGLATPARIIAATSHRLVDRVRAHTFDPDLYYRLNVVHLKVPPLRERRDDILTLLSDGWNHTAMRDPATP